MKKYPTIVSRTLDPNNKSLITVVGLHDHEISDADINLIQDVQDQKRQRVLGNQVSSGAVQYAPFQFNPFIENRFFISTFDVLFNGEIVTIGGNNSLDLNKNCVILPDPPFWSATSTDEPARLYVIFLEMWYSILRSDTGLGYFVNPNGLQYYFPYGCINAPTTGGVNGVGNLILNDAVDPFSANITTQRAAIQWALRVQRIGLGYDFTRFRYGLDPALDTNNQVIATQAAYATGIQLAPIVDPAYTFSNLGLVTGDAGLWRSGNGNVSNSLGTLDGYSYAMPVAVVLQRNSGVFNLTSNIFGCADPNPIDPTQPTGLLRYKASGRYDRKLADSIWPNDVVDTRHTVSFSPPGNSKLIEESFVDLISGDTNLALTRGEIPGNVTQAFGSLLDYYVSVGPTSVAHTDSLGSWDGFANGFSSDQRIFYTSKVFTVENKSSGSRGTRWTQNDSFVVSLPPISAATIEYVNVQCLVNQNDGTKVPTLLVKGQLSVDNLGSKNVTVKLLFDLINTAFDPGVNPLFVTIGVQYDAGVGMDLRKVPKTVYGGVLQDAAVGRTFKVFACSEYAQKHTIEPLQVLNLSSINNRYSDLIFGTRAWITIPGSSGVQTTDASGDVFTKFTISAVAIEGFLNAFHACRVWDLNSENFYTISSRSMLTNQLTFTIQGPVSSTSTVVVSVMCKDTAQLLYNPPVKGVVAIQETVLIGNYNTAPFSTDSRVSIVSGPKFTPPVGSVPSFSTVVFSSVDSIIKGISGDDVNRFIWVKGQSGEFNSFPISSIIFNNGLVTVVVPNVNLEVQPFIAVAALNPAFSVGSQLVIQESYIPYQGEGIIGRDYEIIETDKSALITTNGTGAAPVIGLSDVYPYNRELPIVTMLPAQATWDDSALANTAVSGFSDNNYEGKRFNNIEHTFEVPLHTNDFIEPINKGKRKLLQFQTKGAKGFAKATPHVGFEILRPLAKTILGNNLVGNQYLGCSVC
jgi:hypothetical protein